MLEEDRWNKIFEAGGNKEIGKVMGGGVILVMERVSRGGIEEKDCRAMRAGLVFLSKSVSLYLCIFVCVCPSVFVLANLGVSSFLRLLC